MNELDELKVKANIAKHKANIAELEYKIYERLEDIKRIEDHKQEQESLVKELEDRLKE
jgi:hypothetical protein